MMIELIRMSWTSDDHRPGGLHASENAGAPGRQSFLERIAKGIDLAEQSEHLGVGRHVARDDDVLGDTELIQPRVEVLLDVVESLDEGADIDDERLVPALFQDRGDIEQRIGLLARIDRSEMADHEATAFARRGEPLAQWGVGDVSGSPDIWRQR